MLAVAVILLGGFSSKSTVMAQKKGNDVETMLKQYEQNVDECAKLFAQFEKTGSTSVQNDLNKMIKQAKALKEKLLDSQMDQAQISTYRKITQKLDRIISNQSKASTSKNKPSAAKPKK